MRYPNVAGAVLRLKANVTKCSRDLPRLIRGFQLMGEDDLDLFTLRKEFPVLHDIATTRGDDYSTEQLLLLNEFLSQFLTLPELESGIEAFVRFMHCNPLDYFYRWHVMICKVNRQPESRGSIYEINKNSVYYVDESNLDDLQISDDIEYTEDLNNEIARWGSQVGLGTQPRLYLLWENSD